MRLRFACVCLAAYLVAWCGLAQTASAAPVAIDFESGASVGAQITNQYALHGGVPEGPTFMLPGSAGFSPFGCGPGHLTSAAAHSAANSVVLDGCGGGSEFAATATFFSMGYSTDAVSFWIAEGGGIFTGSHITVVSTAFDAQGSQLQQVVTPLGPQSGPTFHQVSLSSQNFNIAFVAVELGSQNTNPSSPTGVTDSTVDLSSAPLYLDDLSYDPPTAPPNASFVLGAQPAATSTTAGGQAKIKIPVTWTNNPNPSADPITLAATTPTGVTASFSPNPTNTGSSTLTLDVATNAPTGQKSVTVTGTFGSETEHVVIPFGISAAFQIVNPGAITVLPCSAKQVTLTVTTSSSFNQALTLFVTTANQPAVSITGISGANGPGTVVDPSDAHVTVPTQNGLATATLSLSAGPGGAGNPQTPRAIAVQATSSGYATQSNVSGTLAIGPSQVTSVTSGVSFGPLHTPQALQPGTAVTITGKGFCSGSTVAFGNAQAIATPTSVTGTTIQVRVPRLATTGPVSVLTGSPPVTSAPSTQSLNIDSYRNTNGWAFHNYVPSGFDLGELSDLFGVGQVYFSINPCWPFGTCNIPLFPTPTSGILLAVADGTLANSSSGGACMGFSLSTQRILENLVPFNDFNASGNTINSIDTPAGPAAFTTRYINTQALAQFSREFITHYLGTIAAADLSTPTQVVDGVAGEVTGTLLKGRYPLIALHDKNGGGHLVIAYDLEPVGPHEYYIDVYDSNEPFGWDGSNTVPSEELNPDGQLHQSNVQNSRIHVMPDGSWSLPSTGFSGGPDGIVVTDPAAIPAQPSMPTSLPGSGFYFGSAAPVATGSRSAPPPPSRTIQLTGAGGRTLYGPSGLPNTNPQTRLNAAPFAPLVGSRRPRPEMFILGTGATDFTQTVIGTRAGADSYTLLESGLVARIDTRASKGITDQIALRPSAGTIGFSTAANHVPLTLTLTGASGAGAQHTAAVATTSFHGGGDSLAFAGSRNTLTFVHRGAATTFTIQLSSLQRNGLPSSFSSGALPIGSGQTAQITAVKWSNLAGSTLRVRIGHRTMTLANRFHSPRLARIVGLRVRPKRHGAVKLAITAKLVRLPHGAVVAFVWLVRRGGHLVGLHTLRVSNIKRILTRSWKFTPQRAGRYKVSARIMVIAPNAAGGIGSSIATATAGFRRQ